MKTMEVASRQEGIHNGTCMKAETKEGRKKQKNKEMQASRQPDEAQEAILD